MKKLILYVFIIVVCYKPLLSQSDTFQIKYNMITAPTAPGFTILGIEPSSIDEPTTPTDLLASIKNNSNNFKSFPTDYALNFAPGWIFGGSNTDFKDFASNDNIFRNIKQSSTISFATHTNEIGDSASSTQLGIGLKFAIFRGEVGGHFESINNKIGTKLSQITIDFENIRDSLLNANEDYKLINLKIRDFNKVGNSKGILNNFLTKRDKIENKIMNDFISSHYYQDSSSTLKELRQIASNNKFERNGFNLDVGLGLAYDFADQNWRNCRLFKYGAWFNSAYTLLLKKEEYKTLEQKLTWLFGVRILMSPEEQYENNNMLDIADNLRLDVGGRLIYKIQNKFSFSSEFLYRSVTNNKYIPDTYRFTFNVDYQPFPDQILTLVLGRNFDGNFNSDGNLIAALNYIIGFGKLRPQ